MITGYFKACHGCGVVRVRFRVRVILRVREGVCFHTLRICDPYVTNPGKVLCIMIAMHRGNPAGIELSGRDRIRGRDGIRGDST